MKPSAKLVFCVYGNTNLTSKVTLQIISSVVIAFLFRYYFDYISNLLKQFPFGSEERINILNGIMFEWIVFTVFTVFAILQNYLHLNFYFRVDSYYKNPALNLFFWILGIKRFVEQLNQNKNNFE
jgi:hypothetical protein